MRAASPARPVRRFLWSAVLAYGVVMVIGIAALGVSLSGCNELTTQCRTPEGRIVHPGPSFPASVVVPHDGAPMIRGVAEGGPGVQWRRAVARPRGARIMWRRVRRIVLILLMVIVTPSMATASWYRCAYDGVTRSACCCPTRPDHRKKAPAQDASVTAACCCTVTHVASRAPTAAAGPPAPTDVDAAALAVPAMADSPPARKAAVAFVRPRAQGDPPDTLFARRCSLLL